MTSTCATCRWGQTFNETLPDWRLCRVPLPPMLRRPADVENRHVKVNETCALWTERPDVERG